MNSNGLDNSDFYYDEFGNVVFTASYHKKRGYCCQSGCRHCPFEINSQVSCDVPIELNLASKNDDISLEDLAEEYLSQFENDKK